MRRKMKMRRGAAAVETAVLMIVLVPLIMYTLFLEDLLFYKLDLAEAVLATPWDLTGLDYRKDKATTSVSDQVEAVQHVARLTFADHSSAHNTYSDETRDTEGEDHHQALGAHQCWMAKGGEQVTCSMDQGVGLGPSGVASEFRLLNSGGQGSCYAILGVQNYFLPQHFMQWFAKQAMTKEERWTDSAIHENAKNDSYVYPKLEYSVLTDGWALDSMDDEADLNPQQHPRNLRHKFTHWVAVPYGSYAGGLGAGGVGKANEFADGAKDEGFLNGAAKVDGIGDTLLTPPVAWKSDPQREFGGHYASGWSDSRHSGTQGSMENHYLGQAESKW